MKPEPIALFDLDGTLADFPHAMRTELRRLAAPGEVYAFEEQKDEPPHITARRRMIKRQPGFWRDLPRFALGYDVLEMCEELAFDIHVLTKAPKSNFAVWSEKAEWCEENLAVRGYDFGITMTHDKGLVYGKVLVDDWPAYVSRWLEHRPRGLVIMPAHDYNATFYHPDCIRYDGHNEAQVMAALKIKREECEP